MSQHIERVCVIGAVTMGHGIAQVSAQAGVSVTLLDATTELAERGLARVRENLDEGVKRGKVTTQTRDEALALITAGSDMAMAADADLVIEAVPERIELKQNVFRQVTDVLPESSLLATNTSSFSITDLQN